MRCPACTEPSIVYIEQRLERPGKIAPHAVFWDREDKYHVHDSRPYRFVYRCEKGHRFRKVELESCAHCDFGKNSAIIEML